jgi:Tol biopolymer transport system component/DNA-binding winged helix-turn-helix (wHTH) protein
MSPQAFLLGEWRVEPSLNQITRLARGSAPQRITPKAMEVLVVLTGRVGELVTREELLANVWFEVHVQEEVLTRAIADLRKALDDDRKEPRYIETIPKRGYRVVARVQPVSRGKAPRRSLSLWAGGVIAAAALASVLAWGSRDVDPERTEVLEGHPLTTFPGREIHPALSPDGSAVAFAWNGESGENFDIYVKALSGEVLTRVTEDPAFDLAPAWSPDGTRIAFARYADMGDCRIVEVPSRGGDERVLGSCGKSQSPDLVWSPDGRFLAFSDRESDSESFGIYLLSTESGEKRKLVAPHGQHWGDKDPAFSPDGRWVAFTRSVSMNTQDVYRIAVDGGEPQRVTFDGREVRGSAFSPDGGSVVVSSSRSGTVGLWKFPLGERRSLPVRLLFPGGAAQSPAIGARGELLFEERWRDGDIVARPLGAADAPPEPLLVSTHEDREPSLSPDSSRVAFVSNRSGTPEIWVSDAAGGRARKLTSFGGPQVGAPSWSPDGRTILFDARPEGHADVFSVPVEGGTPTPLAPSPANELAPVFAPDGSEVLFGSDRSGKWQIWSAKREKPLTSGGGYAGRFSTDGSAFYVTKFDSPGLFRLDLASGREEKVAGTDALLGTSSWTIDAGGIWFLGADSGELKLFRLLLPSGALSDRGAIDADFGGGLAFDPVRERLLVTRVVRSESDLVLARLP